MSLDLFPQSPPVIDLIPGGNITITTSGNNFTYTQTANLATWTVPHNLNKPYPNVVIVDNNGDQVIGFELSAIDNNTLTIKFKQPVPPVAIAYLS